MKTLRQGDKGPQVAFLQTALIRAKYLSQNEADGIFGAKTASALKNFKKSINLPAVAVADERVHNALMPYYLGYVKRVIKKGDTVDLLSKLYKTNIKAILTANPDVDVLNLKIGSTLIIPLDFEVVPSDIPMTYEITEYCIKGITARYKNVEKIRIGSSVMGKSIYALKIGKGKNAVSYNASHHANEYITSTVLLKFIERYAKAVEYDEMIFRQKAKTLFEASTLFAVPMVNPDGVDLASGELTNGAYFDRAKEISLSYPTIPFPEGWKANITGTDLNSNYPALWEKAKEIKFSRGYRSPAPRDYVGEYPLSAEESRIMAEFTKSGNFSLVIALHTQGEEIYWDFNGIKVESAEKIVRLYEYVSGYVAKNTPSDSFAGYKDWFIYVYKKPGFTVECGKGKNPLPNSDSEKIYTDILGILTLSLLLG